MGNWRSVQLIGTCDASEVHLLKQAMSDMEDFDCLTFTAGGGGLPSWPAEKFDAVGNLAERDYYVSDVETALLRLVGIAPSLFLIAHVGGENESRNCEATILAHNGRVKQGEPLVEEIPEMPKGQFLDNMHAQMRGEGAG